jgi:hypothetical protein
MIDGPHDGEPDLPRHLFETGDLGRDCRRGRGRRAHEPAFFS